MAYTVKVSTAPAEEPVTTAEAKTYLNVTGSGDDTLIGNLVTAARQEVEHYTRRALVTQTLTLALDGFPTRPLPWWNGVREGAFITEQRRVLELPNPPLQSVSSIVYYDLTDTQQTFAASNYVVDTNSEPGLVFLKQGKSWPTDVRPISGILITFIAGYGGASAVPQALKQAILIEVADRYNGDSSSVASEKVGDVSVTYKPTRRTGLCEGAKAMAFPYRIERA